MSSDKTSKKPSLKAMATTAAVHLTPTVAETFTTAGTNGGVNVSTVGAGSVQANGANSGRNIYTVGAGAVQANGANGDLNILTAGAGSVQASGGVGKVYTNDAGSVKISLNGTTGSRPVGNDTGVAADNTTGATRLGGADTSRSTGHARDRGVGEGQRARDSQGPQEKGGRRSPRRDR